MKAANRVKTENAASSQYAGLQPQPMRASPPSKSGPNITPRDPANVQRAIFCSWRAGSESIRLACERLTKAPDEGKNKIKEASKRINE